MSEPRAVVSRWVVNEWKELHDPININFHPKQTKKTFFLTQHFTSSVMQHAWWPSLTWTPIRHSSITCAVGRRWHYSRASTTRRLRRTMAPDLSGKGDYCCLLRGWERPETRRNSSGDQWAARQLPVCERACTHVCACVCMCKYI